MVKALLAGALIATGLLLPAPHAHAEHYCVDDAPHTCQPGNPAGQQGAATTTAEYWNLCGRAPRGHLIWV